MAERRLIGYQVKRLDQLIEATFDRAIDAAGMSRREWQALNTLVGDPGADLVDALRPFWETTEESVAAVIDALIARGWLTRDGHRCVVTAEGRAAHETARDEVVVIRRRMVDGITESEFAVLTGALDIMITNLESAQ
ncbi:MarR family winged helix-turn-helix transcriptional regulator [Nocardia asteroides]|uniref:MarR family winged helix-turn-helix transcriptional regulator n=1 Tax=Nocardia asteroides TaxID=1824 RepID=UPI001E4F89EC|nr:winged helix DNA-binding protein [Nocardia asteroides]UGT54075.1 winged helix DNA-binding protein [Nocardia asteroides]